MRVVAAIVFVGWTAACSSGGSDAETPANSSPPAPVNSPPTISGSPATQVTRDEPYSFTPTASDPDGDALTFTITNAPAWCDFDTASGTLTGTPGPGDVGTVQGVMISVSDGSATASLAPFDLEVLQVQLGSATVSWDTPQTNADGSNLTDLAGFNIHYGQAPRTYSSIIEIRDEAATSALIEDLEPGTWYFAVSAVDSTGNESALSAEVSKVVNP